uniref:Uncharacterized protein n=1 Tax=Parascaris equorum TaxID=6256 RepID=A0A914R951_PAREQ
MQLTLRIFIVMKVDNFGRKFLLFIMSNRYMANALVNLRIWYAEITVPANAQLFALMLLHAKKTSTELDAWLGRTQSAAVKGVLHCNGDPLPRTLVKLFDNDRGLLIALILIDWTLKFSSYPFRYGHFMFYLPI